MQSKTCRKITSITWSLRIASMQQELDNYYIGGYFTVGREYEGNRSYDGWKLWGFPAPMWMSWSKRKPRWAAIPRVIGIWWRIEQASDTQELGISSNLHSPTDSEPVRAESMCTPHSLCGVRVSPCALHTKIALSKDWTRLLTAEPIAAAWCTLYHYTIMACYM